MWHPSVGPYSRHPRVQACNLKSNGVDFTGFQCVALTCNLMDNPWQRGCGKGKRTATLCTACILADIH